MKNCHENLKFEFLFADRIGIVFNITQLLMVNGLNVVAMEVEQEEGKARISIEIANRNGVPDLEALLKMFKRLPGIETVLEITTLPQERRDRWLRLLFENVREGIVSVDERGIINAINSVAERILGQVGENAVGQHITDICTTNSVLAECLAKKISIRKRMSVVLGGGRVEFYASAKPVTDFSGKFVGAMLLMKDLKEVKEMAEAVEKPIHTTFDSFLGESREIRNLISFARKIARSDAIVSIRGQSGTGKELFANAIHFESGKTGPFVPINCAAMPESLLESELFGYADGAFTGARKRGKPGLFEVAMNGTIFLDEIGDMPPGPQAKILRVLQEGLVRRIGGAQEIPVNARIITATNRNLERMVQKKVFREDLYYRINVLPIHIPPLKERKTDIQLLVSTFLHELNSKLGKRNQTLTRSAMDKLMGHDWPGNVRELKNVTERAAILSDCDEIGVESILFSYETNANPENNVAGLFQQKGTGCDLKAIVGQYEKEIIKRALETKSSIRTAARTLGISHTTLQNKIKKYHLIWQ